MAEPTIKPDSQLLGYEPNPELQFLSSQLKQKYDQQYLPAAQSVMAGLKPDAQEEDRLKAAENMKKITGVDQPQLMNAFQSFMAGDPRSFSISMNGGADIPTQAYAPDGSTWTKVFNERKSTQNPNGEVRHYIDSEGKRYSREQAEKLVGGPIVSVVEIPLQQQMAYAAAGVVAKDVAQAQGLEWNKRRNAGVTALRESGSIIDAASMLDDLVYNNPKVIKSSIKPEIRSLVAGIGQLATGDRKAFDSSVQQFNEFAEGKGSNSDWSDFKKNNAGISMGVNYNQGKGFSNSKGEKMDRRDLDRHINDVKNSMSSDNAIQARREELLQRAQFLATKNDPEVINLIQQGVNLEFQKALAIKKIEQAGGIGIAQPTLPNEVGDDFVLAGVKNKLNKNYGQLANVYGNQVQSLEGQYLNRAPAIGEVERLVNSNPLVSEIKAKNKDETINYSRETSKYLRELNPQPVAEVIAQPNVNQTTIARQPPSNAVTENQPAGSKKPSVSPAKKPSVLSSIFGD